MNTNTLMQRVHAPEDIQVGDTIAVTYTRYQLVPGSLDTNVCGQAVEPITIIARPSDAGEPKKVLAVCLPFLMVRCLIYGTHEVIDTRSDIVAKVDKSYAKSAKRKEDKPDPKRKKKKRKGKGKGNKKKKK